MGRPCGLGPSVIRTGAEPLQSLDSMDAAARRRRICNRSPLLGKCHPRSVTCECGNRFTREDQDTGFIAHLTASVGTLDQGAETETFRVSDSGPDLLGPLHRGHISTSDIKTTPSGRFVGLASCAQRTSQGAWRSPDYDGCWLPKRHHTRPRAADP